MTEREEERAAVVAWLRREAQGARNYVDEHPDSGLVASAISRALYYEQALGFIERGDHLKEQSNDA